MWVIWGRLLASRSGWQAIVLVWVVYAGLDLGELPLALRGVEVSGYFAAAVDNCGVVAVSQEAADLLERELGVLAQEVHCDVSSFCDGLSPTGAGEAGERDCKVSRYALYDRLWRWC